MPDEYDDPNDEYDGLADDWSEYAEVPWRAQVLWPVVDELLPGVDGTRVLDAGCGDGHYTALLADRGADAVGIDASAEMVETARDRYGDRAVFHRRDLADGLDPIDDDSVDLVVCQHVLSHVRDLAPVVDEFARVLRPGGALVLSTHHPFHEYLVVREERYPDTRPIDHLDARPAVRAREHPPTYGETEAFDLYWDGWVPERDDQTDDVDDRNDPGATDDANGMTFHRRPLSALTSPLFEGGFALRDFREPDLPERLDDDLLDELSDLARRPPRSLCLRATLSG